MRATLTPKIGLAGLQWMFFILTNTIVVPLTLGHVFQLPPGQITFSLQVSFVLTGAACMLQAYWGHRLALMDGPAGVWWGFTLSIAASAAASGADMKAVGGGLAAGYLLSGLMMAVLGLLGFARILRRLFNPLVISVSLFLLSAQLMANFFTGMLGVGEDGRMNPPVALLSVLIALFVAVVYMKGRGWVSNFAMLFGILLGWAAYGLTFPAPGSMPDRTAAVQGLFPWGIPRVDAGIMAASFIVGFINMSNTVTSLKAAEKLYGEAATESQYRRSFLITGLMTLLTPVFGLIPFGTFTSSMGLLESMKILHRQALAIGGGLFLVLGLIPSLGGWFSGLPVSVGSAVLFVAYLQMFGTAVRSVEGTRFDSKTIYRLALPILLGVSIMNTPSTVFSALPVYLRPLAGNGLVVGILMSLILETCVNWTKPDIAKEKGYD
ncbi:uracil/xanthine transporter [Paenibacillus chitinolyticus]|uniref:uracil/xanthine transporter n=1 Tax=Paenibacillus chitinolyticus TaxID=79263 RepID=UPI002DB6EBE9|nr:uracil/xanthine transporter [Paenibacillus chitinolyticus]MEC0245222.1 uracil/xanthine transporter [Paenibacillus chitinolyticus]